MAMSDHEWKLWRNADPYPQRFTATISPETDLDLIYRRAT
jgi:hypothetical protein